MRIRKPSKLSNATHGKQSAFERRSPPVLKSVGISSISMLDSRSRLNSFDWMDCVECVCGEVRSDSVDVDK